MSLIQSVRVQGLAGRDNEYSAELNNDVSVFFGANGSGKTSLLRILHSALSNDVDLLEDVAFEQAEITTYSFQTESQHTYIILKPEGESIRNQNRLGLLLSGKQRPKIAWTIEPPLTHSEFHRYLPTWRLYSTPTSSSPSINPYQSGVSENFLEARFADNLNKTWRDYTAEVTFRVNRAQEDGLASILKSVILNSESNPSESTSEPEAAYMAVTKFLARRKMQGISLPHDQFLERYAKEGQLRSIAKDIEAVESRIQQIVEPRETFKKLVNELFIRNKSLEVSDKDLDVAFKEKKIGLSHLSSGEKQLLTILVETLWVGPFPILIDEPELSLHVDWQRRLVGAMRILNPFAQVILATHSPEIMADLPDDQIFRI